ncbi:MAG TPA: hypothetical protein VMW32_05305, partial [Bacteroidales bacterium]|nr:hypothetical protein [Bacteroidales bacterium]
MNNPLLGHWETPFETPPFNLIEIHHFRPAVDEAIKSASDEINSITDNNDPPSFENTVAALDRTGEKIPHEIIRKIKEASTFNEGYVCNRQLGFGFLDMAWHTVSEPVNIDVNEFETVVT